MGVKILFITDLHKRWKDSEAIKGSLVVQQKIQEDIIQYNIQNGIDYNIIVGDWYDRGFHGLCQSWGATEMDRRLSASVNGNVYLCIGNHFYLERDENPEMYIIQPNKYIQPQQPIPLPDEPIFKVVPRLRVGSVLIDFFHFSKINKNYVANRDPDVKYHIGVYHDDVAVPGWVSEMDGYTSHSTQSYYNSIYSNIDLAIHGHIHTKIGVVTMTLADGRDVPLYIPGSLGITQNKDSMKHTDVDLPLVEITDNDEVKVSTVKFSNYLGDLRFIEGKKSKKQKLIAEGVLPTSQVQINSYDASMTSLSTYLSKKGYSDLQMRLVNEAMNESLTVGKVVRLLSEVKNIDG